MDGGLDIHRRAPITVPAGAAMNQLASKRMFAKVAESLSFAIAAKQLHLSTSPPIATNARNYRHGPST
jgi:hypothetical protein